MLIEIDILSKDSDSILVEVPKDKTPEAEKPKGFVVYEELELEIVSPTKPVGNKRLPL